MSDNLDSARETLRRVFGHADFRRPQARQSATSGAARSALAVCTAIWYTRPVPIATFADDDTARVFAGERVRGVTESIAKRARRRMQQMDSATQPSDLASPGADLKKLSGVKPETWQIRVNEQYRLRFRVVRQTPLEIAEIWFGDPH